MSGQVNTLCPRCRHSVKWFWNFCPRCAAQLKEDVKTLSAEEIQDLQNENESRNEDSTYSSREA